MLGSLILNTKNKPTHKCGGSTTLDQTYLWIASRELFYQLHGPCSDFREHVLSQSIPGASPGFSSANVLILFVSAGCGCLRSHPNSVVCHLPAAEGLWPAWLQVEIEFCRVSCHGRRNQLLLCQIRGRQAGPPPASCFLGRNTCNLPVKQVMLPQHTNLTWHHTKGPIQAPCVLAY